MGILYDLGLNFEILEKVWTLFTFYTYMDKDNT